MTTQPNARRPSRILASLLGVAVASMLMAGAPAAQAAASVTLCTGFKQCAARGYTNFGYAAVYRSSFWNMRPGHNCTNYAAYRLTHGRLVARPPGTGSGYSWGPAARAVGIKVDNTPKRGDIAWWGKGNVGSKSHVAYVEKVSSTGSVTVSEDNYGGDFRWRRITRGSSRWPSGFIHYLQSDGSPLGALTSVGSFETGKLDLRGSSSDPDGGTVVPSYLVSIGGPRSAEGVETFTFPTEYFVFHRTKTVRSRGAQIVYLYALNTPGTAGVDVLLGKKWVTIR